jgi:hypothetical protein
VPIDLETGLDTLYSVPLDEFVQQRNRLARALRKDGRRAEAAGVQELRKPSLATWTVNRLARTRRKDVDLLLDASHRLASAQRGLLSAGGKAAFAAARKREQSALERLVTEAESILGERASPGVLERVRTTLRAAAASDEARADLARGRLTTELALPGFEAMGGVHAAAAPREKSPARKGKKDAAAERQATSRAQAVERAQAELELAEDAEAGVARRVRQAEQAVKAAQRTLETAVAEADRLRGEHEAARTAVEVARSRLAAAKKG